MTDKLRSKESDIAILQKEKSELEQDKKDALTRFVFHLKRIECLIFIFKIYKKTRNVYCFHVRSKHIVSICLFKVFWFKKICCRCFCLNRNNLFLKWILRNSFRYRISKLVSVKLRDSNPNIADLDDKYKPTKLAEMFSELYDNEWTDAYTVLTESLLEEDICLAFLLDIVKVCLF